MATKKKDGKKKGRPIGPFFVFQKEMRPIVVKEMPGAKQPEIAKELGRRWKKLTDEEKEKYKQQSTEPEKEE